MNRAILVFLKLPEPGKVKTRLAEGIGKEAAVDAYRRLVCRVFEQCRRSRPDVIGICYDPAESEGDIHDWLDPLVSSFPGELVWIPQTRGALGERLESGVEAFFEKFPETRLAVIGTDCIELFPAIFEECWAHLDGMEDTVFGPAEDGGYYLLGLRKSHNALFRDISWSSEKTLSESLAAAAQAGLPSPHLLPTKVDIDTEVEWKRFGEELKDRSCIFFDRDGVVNRSPGPGYLLSPDDFHLQDGIAESIAEARRKEMLAILVTSQRGVGKGLMSEEDLRAIHQRMQSELQEKGVEFDGIYAYTETPECPYLPKPDPNMIFRARNDFFVDVENSWLVGDADRDIDMGRNAGLRGTIRVVSDKEVGVVADFTIKNTSELPDLFKNVE